MRVPLRSFCLALAAVACGSAPLRRSELLVPGAEPAVSITYTSSVRRGVGRTAGGLVRLTSREEHALDLDVLCVALPESEGTIAEDVAAVLRAERIHLEPGATSELVDVDFAGPLPDPDRLYDVPCGVRPVGGSGPYVFPGIANGALQSFRAREPNLLLGAGASAADVHDCETEALPVRGRPICVRPVIDESALATEMLLPELDRHLVRCELGGEAREESRDTRGLGEPLVFRFEATQALAVGPLEVACTIDPDDVLAERDETDNAVRVTSTLLESEAGWSSTLRLVTGEVSARHVPGSGETGAAPRWTVPVRFVVEGHPIRAAEITCTSASGLRASGGFGMGGLPENLTLPGEHVVPVDVVGAPGEREVLDCTASVTSPTSLRVELVGAAITARFTP